MRIGCLQFAPQVGDVQNNLSLAEDVLGKLEPQELENLDLLVLPEMAFSGYNFQSLEEITPFLEDPKSGISLLWARTAALKYDCTVAVGYPECAAQGLDAGSQGRESGVGPYNSVVVVNRDGEIIANYRKSFLYYTDETWALEGSGFYKGEINGLGQVAMGICMDINPYKFEAPWNAYEFATHVVQVKANLVIVSMAWLTQQPEALFCLTPRLPDMETLTYWVQRLEPVIRAEQEGEIIVVLANRCGVEGGAVYAGTSAVLGIRYGEVAVYGLLGRGQNELLVVDTDDPPFGKLSLSPDPTPQPEGEPHTVDPASEIPAPIERD